MPQNEIRPALQEYLNCPDEQYATEAAIIGRKRACDQQGHNSGPDT